MMRLIKQSRAAPVGAALVIAALGFLAMSFKGEGSAQEPSAPSPVLSVALTQAQETILSLRVPATGNVVAWQEASVGAEADGLRLVAVNVNVGDTVKRGQVLALFYGEIVAAELAEAIASVAQAQAEMLEAEANHKRAQVLDKSGAMSAQQVNQLLVAAMTARARLDAARALEHKSRLRLAQTQVLAPSDGVISSRTATVGAVIPTGQELFRLIEDGRLEWRALIATADIDQLRAGQKASLSVHGQQLIPGTVRMLAPTINTATHNGLVYIDLPPNTALRAGMFARGYVDVSEGVALTLPQRAVMLRDGFHYVMQVGADSIVTTKKVSVGRHVDEHIEITSGLVASEQVIESGLGFLSEGDVVRVVSAPAQHTHQTTAVNPPRATAALRE